jgi:hypothetical protein
MICISQKLLGSEMKSDVMEGHVAYMKKRNAYGVLVGKIEGKSEFEDLGGV